MTLEKLNVLIVDDEQSFADTLARDLAKRNIGTSVAYNGENALEIVKRNPPDIMILDLQMPEMDGLTVLKSVKNSHPQVQVMILTGKANESEEATAYSMGAYSFLQKPVEVDVLFDNLGITFAEKVASTIVAASLAEGGAFEAADEMLNEIEELSEAEAINNAMAHAETAR